MMKMLAPLQASAHLGIVPSCPSKLQDPFIQNVKLWPENNWASRYLSTFPRSWYTVAVPVLGCYWVLNAVDMLQSQNNKIQCCLKNKNILSFCQLHKYILANSLRRQSEGKTTMSFSKATFWSQTIIWSFAVVHRPTYRWWLTL